MQGTNKTDREGEQTPGAAANIVTVEDHDAGFKELSVEYRNGGVEKIKLIAPSHRRAQALNLQIIASQSLVPVVNACLEGGTGLNLDKLTPDSANLVEFVALALTFGNNFQKKMQAAGLAVVRQLHPTLTPPGAQN